MHNAPRHPRQIRTLQNKKASGLCFYLLQVGVFKGAKGKKKTNPNTVQSLQLGKGWMKNTTNERA